MNSQFLKGNQGNHGKESISYSMNRKKTTRSLTHIPSPRCLKVEGETNFEEKNMLPADAIKENSKKQS